MFVAVDEENKRVYGPFEDQAQGEDWVEGYLDKVEGHGELTVKEKGIDFWLWNVQEVQFVDPEDTEFTAFVGPVDDKFSEQELSEGEVITL